MCTQNCLKGPPHACEDHGDRISYIAVAKVDSRTVRDALRGCGTNANYTVERFNKCATAKIKPVTTRPTSFRIYTTATSAQLMT